MIFIWKSLKLLLKAQSLATDQRRNFGEEIAQSIRLTKRKRWEVMENKRKLQEIELESYLINLVLKDGETAEVIYYNDPFPQNCMNRIIQTEYKSLFMTSQQYLMKKCLD